MIVDGADVQLVWSNFAQIRLKIILHRKASVSKSDVDFR